MNDLILNNAQCLAVYSAMCELNVVGGKLNCTFASQKFSTLGAKIFVRENDDGTIEVAMDGKATQGYIDQRDFAEAYGIA